VSTQLLVFVELLVAHWVADFVLQTHWQATNKSRSHGALAQHVAVYTIVMGAAAAVLFGVDWPWVRFVVLNGVLHYWTDYFTSRWSSRLYAKQDWHNFFVVIGFDQLIHHVTLATTMWLIFYEAHE
jgi:hypothetical protein